MDFNLLTVMAWHGALLLLLLKLSNANVPQCSLHIAMALPLGIAAAERPASHGSSSSNSAVPQGVLSGSGSRSSSLSFLLLQPPLLLLLSPPPTPSSVAPTHIQHYSCCSRAVRVPPPPPPPTPPPPAAAKLLLASLKRRGNSSFPPFPYMLQYHWWPTESGTYHCYFPMSQQPMAVRLSFSNFFAPLVS